MSDPATKFRKIIQELPSQSKIAVITQDNPDPDAMGAAWGVSFLARRLNPTVTDVQIFYGGAISHPQNRTMYNILNLPMQKIKALNPDEYNLVILVDAASTGKKNVQSTSVQPDIIIDHHLDNPEGDYLLKDIRPIGAASTIVTSYMQEYGIDLESRDEDTSDELKRVATGLLVGIKTDTNELTSPNTTPLDFQCYEYLLSLVDRKKLYQIINYTLPPYLYHLKAIAYKDMEIQHSVVVAGVGIISPSQRDAISIIADELLRMEGIETVVVYAIIDDRIVASVRTKNDGIEMNAFCHQIFGEEYSGGKRGCGGASVPLGFLTLDDTSNEKTRDSVWEAVRAVVSHRVFRTAASG